MVITSSNELRVRNALSSLWTDRCAVYVRAEKIDESGLTDFTETLLVEDQPCKLSFGTLTQASGDPVATAGQVVKLFLTPDIEIPAGSRIVVTRNGGLNRVFEYVSSGEPGVFHDHQEIFLEKAARFA